MLTRAWFTFSISIYKAGLPVIFLPLSRIKCSLFVNTLKPFFNEDN